MKHTQITKPAEKGTVFVYVALGLTVLIGFVAMAIDFGRAYVVRLNIGKALDAAGIAGARFVVASQDESDQEAAIRVMDEVFGANFKPSYFGADQDDIRIVTREFLLLPDRDAPASIDIKLTSNFNIPSYFLNVVDIPTLNIGNISITNRKFVDLCVCVDTSGSLSGNPPQSLFDQIKPKIEQFVGLFNQNVDRIALVSFATVSAIDYAFPAGRGFRLDDLRPKIEALTASGYTATGEGLRRCLEEFERVAGTPDTPAVYRAVALITDGTPNTIGGTFYINPSGTPTRLSGIASSGDLEAFQPEDQRTAVEEGYVANREANGLYYPTRQTGEGDNSGTQIPGFFMNGEEFRGTYYPPNPDVPPEGLSYDPSDVRRRLLPIDDRREPDVLGAPIEFNGRFTDEPGLITRTVWNIWFGTALSELPPEAGGNPQWMRQRVWCDLNSMSRNHAELVGNRLRDYRINVGGVSLLPVVIHALGFGRFLGEVNGCADRNPPFGDRLGDRERGRHLLARIANADRFLNRDAGVMETNDNFNPSQPQGIYIEAPEPADLDTALRQIYSELVSLKAN